MEASYLGKNLYTLEDECRALRDEVALLEKMRRLGAQDAVAIADIPHQDSARRSTKGGRGQKRPPSLPIEIVGELNDKAGAVTLLMRENKKLKQERQKLQATLATIRTDITGVNEESGMLQNRIDGSHEDGKSRVKDPVIINETNALKHSIVESLLERDRVQKTLQRQTYMLREMISQIMLSRDLDKEKDEANQQLAEKRDELNSIREEARSMLRLLERKDVKLENTVPVDPYALVCTAETERRVAHYRLEREQENVRLNESSIRHRALQIAKLENRIEMIGDAVGGEAGAMDERVDALLIEQLRKEISSLTRLHREGGARIQILDADVADLDRRSNGLFRTTANIKKEMKRIEKNHRKCTNAQQRELEMEQALAEEEIMKLQGEIKTLRKFTKRTLPNASKR